MKAEIRERNCCSRSILMYENLSWIIKKLYVEYDQFEHRISSKNNGKKNLKRKQKKPNWNANCFISLEFRH